MTDHPCPSCSRKHPPGRCRDAETGDRSHPQRLYVALTEAWWEPVPGDPAWWRTVEPCETTCHHPVHAFHPERRRHLEEASFILAAGTPTGPVPATQEACPA